MYKQKKIEENRGLNTHNQGVTDSSPVGPTLGIKQLQEVVAAFLFKATNKSTNITFLLTTRNILTLSYRFAWNKNEGGNRCGLPFIVTLTS